MYNKLDLVNACLIALGNEKVSDLEFPDTDTDIAITVVEEAMVETLSMGWWFNQEDNWKLSLDSDGRVKMPTSVIDFRTVRLTRHAELVKRSGYLYDKHNHTFDLSLLADHNRQIDLDMLMSLEIEDCPVVAQQYIRAISRTRFVQDLDSNSGKITRLAESELKYLALLERQHYRNSKFNVYGHSRVQLVLGGMTGPNTFGGTDTLNPLGGGE